MSGAVLVYVYDTLAEDPTPPPDDQLRPDRLLVSPMMTNHQPWRRGYFQTVASRPLDLEADLLDVHCFRRWDGRYFDDDLNELPSPREPVGDDGIHSFRTIDDQISDAVGISRAP